MISDDDIKHIERAINEASKSKSEDDRTHPRVGVVVVKDGDVLATAHRGESASGEHGEYIALEKKLSTQPISGATLYTTLEPCTTRNHPKVPCAVRLIERRIKRVVIGMLDPNPSICGKGLWLLRESNVETDLFPHDYMAQVEELNRDFVRSHRGLHPTRTLAKEAPQLGESAARVKHESTEADKSPDANWMRWFGLMEKRDFVAADTLFNEISEAEGTVRKLQLHALRLGMRAELANDAEALSKLHELAEKNDEGAKFAAFQIARVLADTGDLSTALSKYHRAIELANDPNTAAAWTIQLSNCAKRLGESDVATKAILGALTPDLNRENKARLLVALSDLPSALPGQTAHAKAALLLKAALLTPTDTSARFDACYALAGVGLTQVALRHYEALVRADPSHSTARNNLGVALARLDIASRSISAYREALERGSTLAAANLAARYKDAGFLEDAEQILSAAMSSEHVHENVGSGLVSVREAKKQEEETYKGAITTGEEDQLFLENFVDALLGEGDASFAGRWSYDDAAELEVDSVLAGEFEAEWGKTYLRRRLAAKVEGRAAVGHVSRWDIVDEKFGHEQACYAYLTADGSQLRIMQILDGATRHLQWTRITTNSISQANDDHADNENGEHSGK